MRSKKKKININSKITDFNGINVFMEYLCSWDLGGESLNHTLNWTLLFLEKFLKIFHLEGVEKSFSKSSNSCLKKIQFSHNAMWYELECCIHVFVKLTAEELMLTRSMLLINISNKFFLWKSFFKFLIKISALKLIEWKKKKKSFKIVFLESIFHFIFRTMYCLVVVSKYELHLIN